MIAGIRDSFDSRFASERELEGWRTSYRFKDRYSEIGAYPINLEGTIR